MQAEHQHAILGLGLVERLLQRNAARAGIELILEGAGVLGELLRLDDVHLVLDVPEPEIGFRQRLVQGLGACDRNQTFPVGAAEENGDAHFLSATFPHSSFRGATKSRARNP
jgi:hypothetical protein